MVYFDWSEFILGLFGFWFDLYCRFYIVIRVLIRTFWKINKEATALIFFNYQCHGNYQWTSWWFQFFALHCLTNQHEWQNWKYPSIQCQIALISITLGQNYNTLWTVCVIGISWIFWIIVVVARFLRLCHCPFSNVFCVSNILPRLVKLTLLYTQVSLCRLVWLTDFLEFNHPRETFASKDTKYISKKQIICTFVAFFLFKY